MSLPFFKENGWEAEVLTTDQQLSDAPKDPLLTKSIPKDILVHTVKALNKKWTMRIGFGNIAYRSWWFYKQKGNDLLKQKQFDLIYFSTTQFSACTLGAYWRRRFGIPYVIDMQDPWHTDYYLNKPKHERPAKHWLSYRVNKWLESKAMKDVGGLISVSPQYIADLKARYPEIKDIPTAIITFGSSDQDMAIAKKHGDDFPKLLNPTYKNVVYIGRGGTDMHKAITPFFESIKQGLSQQPEAYNRLRLHFIGTSYAPQDTGTPTILPLAKEYELEGIITEVTNRISYYHALSTIKQADALFIPGSDDAKYTASKIYPYLLSKKPLLAIFHRQSPAISTLKEFDATDVHNFDNDAHLQEHIRRFLMSVLEGKAIPPVYNADALVRYSAKELTRKQCELFDSVIES
ncbi:hypothetical protein DYU05_16655 [Mucilaginibacter terrenus]|uniref:Glycosyltransferase subfamily 4-like N-terminal domain-containing protein n=1 Tax=Mucilaginibacter terrenus TaxID=2482727 RepID=A0A3E2NN55_9SPHI|nr:hypothetical protein DYU05_16655 [Mucilaginibacter terrenus]